MVTSSARSFYFAPFAALLAVLVYAASGYATCDPTTDPDKSDIANARAAVAAHCDCATAATHGAFVSCAARQANIVLVNQSCAGIVKQCASKSICGRPGFVSCCRTSSTGRTSCAIKRKATECVAPKSGTACVGTFASCCDDACQAIGCTPTTTTTTMPVGSCGFDSAGVCGGTCPDPREQCGVFRGVCYCIGSCAAPFGLGSCGGLCPSPAICTVNPQTFACGCNVPCAQGTAPACGGLCPPGQRCVFLNATTSTCGCVP
jgi:hypothetical protein